MHLTDLAIRNAKPKDRAYKLSDGGGLFLWVQPNSSKWHHHFTGCKMAAQQRSKTSVTQNACRFTADELVPLRDVLLLK